MKKSSVQKEKKDGTGMEFFEYNADRIFTYPAIEMAGERVTYVNDVLYFYIESSNNSISNNDEKLKKREDELFLLLEKEKEPYLPCLFEET